MEQAHKTGVSQAKLQGGNSWRKRGWHIKLHGPGAPGEHQYTFYWQVWRLQLCHCSVGHSDRERTVRKWAGMVNLIEGLGRIYLIIFIKQWPKESPFADARSEDHISQCVRQGNRPAMDPIPEDTPAEIIHLMQSCWAQDPMQRPTFKGMLLFFGGGGQQDNTVCNTKAWVAEGGIIKKASNDGQTTERY